MVTAVPSTVAENIRFKRVNAKFDHPIADLETAQSKHLNLTGDIRF